MNIQVPQRDKQSETTSPEEKEEEGDAMDDIGKIQKYYFRLLILYYNLSKIVYLVFQSDNERIEKEIYEVENGTMFLTSTFIHFFRFIEN